LFFVVNGSAWSDEKLNPPQLALLLLLLLLLMMMMMMMRPLWRPLPQFLGIVSRSQEWWQLVRRQHLRPVVVDFLLVEPPDSLEPQTCVAAAAAAAAAADAVSLVSADSIFGEPSVDFVSGVGLFGRLGCRGRRGTCEIGGPSASTSFSNHPPLDLYCTCPLSQYLSLGSVTSWILPFLGC
jgi:hypothetical protein